MKNLILLVIAILISAGCVAKAGVLVGMVEFDPGTGKIGVQVSPGGKVVRVHPQSPAQECGLLPGDKIISVDGRQGDYGHIHGTVGTTVTLMIQRGGEQIVRDVERINEHLIQPYNINSQTAVRSDPGAP
ncbi:MAG TPA: PDZ domain-containing protein [Trichormus sp.]|jgi:S1-C subfamily serine protease